MTDTRDNKRVTHKREEEEILRFFQRPRPAETKIRASRNENSRVRRCCCFEKAREDLELLKTSLVVVEYCTGIL
ncbi:hypothetical protein BV898_06116 [Hypsibius exemplaris]|uniref:Uncharacterized protein n=1 Tax=Hypsibius exemplaris TaxID=2072580 RepID=A0A1W0WXB8_HYPEX|nr:hypothetical protein BV898_06116 [Hypsibius exemplaris]